MNTKKIGLLAAVAALVYSVHVDRVTTWVPGLKGLQWVSEAEAVLGVRRRTRRRTAVVVSSATRAQDQQAAAAASAQAATPAPAPAPAAAAPAATAAPAPAGAPPLGSIVTVLPGGCSTEAIGGVQYNNCSGVYYRTAFQGNNLVYVVAQP